MARIVLEVSTEQKRQLKTIASYSGISMKDFIISRVFSSTNKKPKASIRQLQKAQVLFFDKSEIIIASTEKWSSLQKDLS